MNAGQLKRRNKRLEFKQWFLDLKKGKKCSHCPENYPACLDYHHVDPKTKWKDGIHSAVRSWSKRRVLEEIAKCIILCANCHRKLEDEIQKKRSLYTNMSGTELVIKNDIWESPAIGGLLDVRPAATPIEAPAQRA